MPVILEAFGKRTDVYQVIGLKYNKGRGEYADFVHRNIQPVSYTQLPKKYALGISDHYGKMEDSNDLIVNQRIVKDVLERVKDGGTNQLQKMCIRDRLYTS